MPNYDNYGSPRTSFHARISEAAQVRVRADASRLGMPIGEYVEMLIFDRGVTHTDYYAQQAAVQSFITAGLIVAAVSKQVGAERAAEIRQQATKAADGLFGQVRKRPITIGEVAPDEDPRILALFEAFGAD